MNLAETTKDVHKRNIRIYGYAIECEDEVGLLHWIHEYATKDCNWYMSIYVFVISSNCYKQNLDNMQYINKIHFNFAYRLIWKSWLTMPMEKFTEVMVFIIWSGCLRL